MRKPGMPKIYLSQCAKYSGKNKDQEMKTKFVFY